MYLGIYVFLYFQTYYFARENKILNYFNIIIYTEIH